MGIPLGELGEAEDVANAVACIWHRTRQPTSQDRLSAWTAAWQCNAAAGTIRSRENMKRRVVITGMGAVSPMGNTAEEMLAVGPGRPLRHRFHHSF